MKILLVRPPHCSPVLKFLYSTEPLGLEAVAAGVAANHDVQLMDMRVDRRSLATAIAEFQPDLVGTSGFTPDVNNIRRLLREVKSIDPAIKTVIGGHHATIAPADFADHSTDAIVIGLGEETFAELTATYECSGDLREVRGIALPRDGSLVHTEARPMPPNLDHLPFPLRDLNLNPPYREHYQMHGAPLGMISTARGCPYRCRFCSIVTEMKGRFITKSPERVVEELATIEQPFVRFADGNSFGNPKRMERLCELVAATGLKKRYLFDIRSDTVVKSPDLIERWAAEGLEYVAIGLESASDEQLERYNKAATTADNIRALKILRAAGIKVLGQFMVDPSFDEADFDRLIAFVLEHEIHLPTFLITTPYPGTELYEEQKGELRTDDYSKFDTLHSLVKPKLPLETFFSRFFGLYEEAYSLRRLGARWLKGIGGGKGQDDVSPLKLMVMRALLGFKKKQLVQEFLTVR